jgi:hypothetical protein
MNQVRGSADVVLLGRLVMGAGVASAVTGAAGWVIVRSQLAAERIVVPGSSRWLPGRTVKGPLTALAESEAIRQIALAATEGRTYGELEEDDPAAQMAMNASLLRASLFTSVLAFGVAAAQVAVGAALVVVGVALTAAGRELPDR